MYAVESGLFLYRVYGSHGKFLGFVKTHSMSYAKAVANDHWGFGGYAYITEVCRLS